jgi:hypothetical protein
MTINEMPTCYIVTLLPLDNPNCSIWSFNVEWCGKAWNGDPRYADRQWAVRRMGACLSRGGKMTYEPQPSSRTAGFYKNHRFTLDEALAAARKHVGKIVVNGMTAADVA